MLSSRPTPHHQAYHAPHKENLYPSSLLSSKTPARGGLSIHKDAGGAGARTVGKPGAVKTPFGGGGPSKGTMTTGGRKGLGAGPSGKGRSDNEGNIAPLRLFQGGATLPHSKSATFAPATTTTSSKPSFGNVTNGAHSQQQQPLRTPAPPSKRSMFATPGPGGTTRKAAAVFQTPLPSASRTTRRRSSKLHTPLEQQQQAAPFSTPTDRTLPADASFELELAAPTLTDLAEGPALAEEEDDIEVEYMPAFSSASYTEPLSFGYDVADPIELGKAIRAMTLLEPWDEEADERWQQQQVSSRGSGRASPIGWETAGWATTDHFRWTARATAGSEDEDGYNSDEDLAALLNLPVSALKAHQRGGASTKALQSLPGDVPSRRPMGGLGAAPTGSSASALARQRKSAVPSPRVGSMAVGRQRLPGTVPALTTQAATASTAGTRRTAPLPTAGGMTTSRLASHVSATLAAAGSRTRTSPSSSTNKATTPSSRLSTLSSRPYATTTTARSSAALQRGAPLVTARAGRQTGNAAGSQIPTTSLTVVGVASALELDRAQRLAEHRADRAFVLAGLDDMLAASAVDADDARLTFDV